MQNGWRRVGWRRRSFISPTNILRRWPCSMKGCQAKKNFTARSKMKASVTPTMQRSWRNGTQKAGKRSANICPSIILWTSSRFWMVRRYTNERMKKMDDKYTNEEKMIDFSLGIESMRKFFAETWNVDMLGGQVISLPGLSERCLYATVGPHLSFVLPQVTARRNNQDMHDVCRRGIVGGPSLVYSRLMRVGQDRIRDREKGRVCKNIIGQDANMLYPWSSAQPQATQMPRRYDLQRDGSYSSRQVYPKTDAEVRFVEWEAYVRGEKIFHRFNGGITFFGHNQFIAGDRLRPEESNSMWGLFVYLQSTHKF